MIVYLFCFVDNYVCIKFISYRECLLLGLGNPLLDISANADDDFLSKYGLEPNNAILAGAEHQSIYEDMEKKFTVDYFAGGATQNSMRVAQWILNKPLCCSFMGCVGKDKYSSTLEEKAKKAGVNVKYEYSDQYPTGNFISLYSYVFLWCTSVFHSIIVFIL